MKKSVKKNSRRSTKVLKKTAKYVSAYKFSLILSILFACLSVGFALYLPILTGQAIDCIAGQGKVDFDGVYVIILKIAVSVGIISLSQWLMNICNTRITYNVVRDIRADAFIKLQSLELKYIDSHSHGDIISRVITDVDQFADGLLLGFTQLFTGIATIVGTFAFMVSINVYIALIVFVLTPMSLFAARFIASRTYRLFKAQSEIRGEETAFIDEMINNQRVVKVYSQEKRNVERFDEMNDRLEKTSLKATFFSSLTNPTTRFINSFVTIAVALSGAYFTIAGAITVGALSSFISYAGQFAKPFNEISEVITELQNAFACAARFFELLEQPGVLPDAENAKVLDDPEGNVALDKVCFSYTPDKKLIENFNLSVKSGQRVAIVGPTGCGKTTIINLLMRFYDVNSGKILVDETDIRDITRHSLRQSYGMVLQETWIKTGTVFENIAIGKPDATLDEVVAAAKATHAHGFIKRLENGYNTLISDEGGALSQGQKQLLCITRIMLSLPSMLILDEATSSIDTRTEIRIQRAFAKLMKGKTSFIVAHRLSTIKEADIILVMKSGSVIEQGTHEQLLANNGFYAELYNSQFA